MCLTKLPATARSSSQSVNGITLHIAHIGNRGRGAHFVLTNHHASANVLTASFLMGYHSTTQSNWHNNNSLLLSKLFTSRAYTQTHTHTNPLARIIYTKFHAESIPTPPTYHRIDEKTSGQSIEALALSRWPAEYIPIEPK